MDSSRVKDRDMEEVWEDMKRASDEGESAVFKVHMLEYIKANPGIGLDELEVAFRGAGFRFYLYALTAEVPYSQCLIGPHGQRDVEYVWTLNPRARPRHFNAIGHRMAATPEENLQRLKRAGTVEDELLPICHVCRGIYPFGSSPFPSFFFG